MNVDNRLTLRDISMVMEHLLLVHEGRWHPLRGATVPLAEPFQEDRLGDRMLATCVERLESECDLSVGELADEMDIPHTLLIRELSYYKARLLRHWGTVTGHAWL